MYKYLFYFLISCCLLVFTIQTQKLYKVLLDTKYDLKVATQELIDSRDALKSLHQDVRNYYKQNY